MFDRNGFVAFVGNASGTMYASGLENIEKVYGVDIDDEINKDNCANLLSRIDEEKKTTSGNDRHNRQNWSSHLKKYVEFKGKPPVEMQKQRFLAWFKQQPQRNQPGKLYADATINGAVNLLQSGLQRLGVPGYENVNCFAITDAEEFKALYTACYAAATEFDKNAGVGDFRNGLDFYLQFLIETAGAGNAEMLKKVRFVIAHYKANFATVNKQERYKWEAIYWYKQHWDIDAPDFAKMLATAFSKASNLLSSGMYYPYKMITDYANENPEAVRNIFRILHDEQRPLAERYQIFKDSCQTWIEKLTQTLPDRSKSLNHYQDPRAVLVYLTFQYPEKYYLFKSTMYSTFRDRVGFVEPASKTKSVMQKIENYTKMCDVILEEVRKDTELLSMHKERLDSNCYQDEALHLLTMDIVFYGSNYMSEDLFGVNDNYWPSLKDYDPGITKDMWIAILQDASVTTDEARKLLNMFLELGGESTFNNLAAHFGNQFYYKETLQEFSARVINKVNCAECPKEYTEFAKYIIPFVGRMVMDGDVKRDSWKLRDELREALEELIAPEIVDVEETMDTVTDVGLNTILYGPPGTGKTYHTVIYAVAIIENKNLDTIKAEAKTAYKKVLERYNEYKAQGRIEFTTFHQSYGYEEFIEGIKPIPDDSENITYKVMPGIFKDFCERANISGANIHNLGIAEDATVWKVSLGGAGDNDIRTDCLENGYIRIGWEKQEDDASGSRVMNALTNRMQIGDIVFSCYSEYIIDAIGVVTGEYEWREDCAHYRSFRKVDWVAKNIREDIKAINGGKRMMQPTVCGLPNVSISDVYKLIEKYQPTQQRIADRKDNYVFVIDEINRGNISKIFGELITLIEESKRVGKEEGMKTSLPYSMMSFGVPENVYIIGTMNTADRSIATIDTALRRRFEFKEMLPDPKVVAGISVGNLSIKTVLEKMNRRIAVLYDREHTIGHAYFMPLAKDNSIEKLAEIFKNKVIPLLQEYFYEDYEKIRLVLADNQKKDEQDQFILAKKINQGELFGNADIGLDDGFTYEINEDAFMNPEAYRLI